MAIDLIADYFGFRENNTNLRIETLAGVTTFMTMSYIIFVQPAVLGAAGMDKGAVMVATCIGECPVNDFDWDYWQIIPLR